MPDTISRTRSEGVLKLSNGESVQLGVVPIHEPPHDATEEPGFGGGITLPSLMGAAFVGGVDRSREMVRRAKASFSEAVSAGRADFQGNVEGLPFEASSKSVHRQHGLLLELARRGLRGDPSRAFARSRVVVGFLPKDRMDRIGMPTDIFTSRAPDDVIAALTKAGFSNMRVTRPEPTTPWNVIVAIR